MNQESFEIKFKKDFSNQPAFRLRQIQQAWFDPKIKNWGDLTNLPKNLRQDLEKLFPWNFLRLEKIISSKNNDATKALLNTQDHKNIETVLMVNRRGQLTICLSCQVGCAMACTFCATGSMGLIRSLTVEEIIDQYRFWVNYILDKPELPRRISNIVLMGMGEPLNNYQNVKQALNLILKYTDIGQTRITVSTVGILPVMVEVLKDPEWPPVRIAISLHGANFNTRKKIIPTTTPDFFEELVKWSKSYLKDFGNRRHHLSFEYIMINGVNDSLTDAKDLADLVKRIGKVKINLIPFNTVNHIDLQNSRTDRANKFFSYLEQHDVTVTIRRSMGEDISAACGQLVTSIKK